MARTPAQVLQRRFRDHGPEPPVQRVAMVEHDQAGRQRGTDKRSFI
jgi:hypothetical protein